MWPLTLGRSGRGRRCPAAGALRIYGRHGLLRPAPNIRQYGVAYQDARMPCLPGPEHEPLSEQRLAIGRGNTSAPARRPGRRTRLERGLDGVGDESRGLFVDDDVPAEQNAADDLPGIRGRVMRADGGGLGHTRTVEETVLVRLPDTPDLQRLLRRSPGGAYLVRGSAGDRVANRSILDRPDTRRAQVSPTPAPCHRCWRWRAGARPG